MRVEIVLQNLSFRIFFIVLCNFQIQTAPRELKMYIRWPRKVWGTEIS